MLARVVGRIFCDRKKARQAELITSVGFADARVKQKRADGDGKVS